MSQRTEFESNEAAILSRLGGPDAPTLPAAEAEAMLTLSFSQSDQDRMRTLAARARAGALTQAEEAEVEAYSRVNSLLGVLKSIARRSLRRHRGPAGKAKAR
jgi:hypothetical protein